MATTHPRQPQTPGDRQGQTGQQPGQQLSAQSSQAVRERESLYQQIVRHDRRGAGNINVGPLERWLSLGVGAMLVGGGLTQLIRRSWLTGALGFGAGAYLFYRGATAHDMVYDVLGINRAGQQSTGGITVEEVVTINVTPEVAYRFWRDFERLPIFMRHLKSVTVSDATHSHWVAAAPLGSEVAWDAEITEDRPNQFIGWRSLPDAQIAQNGAVRFIAAPGDRGVEAHVSLAYDAPAGSFGAVVARVLGEEPSSQIQDDLHRFKALLETGEIPTTVGQPTGRWQLAADYRTNE
ncbi:MAG: SRPBCC family protein [Ktedonobacterales bacterium]